MLTSHCKNANLRTTATASSPHGSGLQSCAPHQNVSLSEALSEFFVCLFLAASCDKTAASNRFHWPSRADEEGHAHQEHCASVFSRANRAAARYSLTAE